MSNIRIALRASLALAVALCADAAFAQRTMYRCTSEGRAYLSDRPCEGGSPSASASPSKPSLASIGPTNASPRTASRDRPVGKATEVLDYLSPECAELREGLRNGPARGITSRTYSELVGAYQKRCADEEREANKRLAEDNQRKREMRAHEDGSEKFEKDRAKLTREQCDEMYRIAHAKRPKLATMTPGERADFDRFDATRRARCGA